MRSTPPHRARRGHRSSPGHKGWLAVAAAVAMVVAGGCSGGRHATASSSPATTLVQVDNWSAPRVTGPPSDANFCALLTAMYRHEAEIPDATTAVREKILRDYVATVPEALAEAPPDVAGAAGAYLPSVAKILSALASAGLDYKKIPPGTLTPLLLDPKIKAAGNQVLEYSRSRCHYAIGGS